MSNDHEKPKEPFGLYEERRLMIQDEEICWQGPLP
jgi:hypothetical protein